MDGSHNFTPHALHDSFVSTSNRSLFTSTLNCIIWYTSHNFHSCPIYLASKWKPKLSFFSDQVLEDSNSLGVCVCHICKQSNFVFIVYSSKYTVNKLSIDGRGNHYYTERYTANIIFWTIIIHDMNIWTILYLFLFICVSCHAYSRISTHSAKMTLFHFKTKIRYCWYWYIVK